MMLNVWHILTLVSLINIGLAIRALVKGTITFSNALRVKEWEITLSGKPVRIFAFRLILGSGIWLVGTILLNPFLIEEDLIFVITMVAGALFNFLSMIPVTKYGTRHN